MEQEKIYINYENITKYLKDRPPYIFVDEAEVVPGVSAKGIKNFTNNEWYFNCHYPNNPIVPAVFQMEAIMQTASLALYTLEDKNIDFVYAQKTDNVEIKQPVRPGQRIFINVIIESFKRGIAKVRGEAFIDMPGGGECSTLLFNGISINSSKTFILKFAFEKVKHTIKSLLNLTCVNYQNFMRGDCCV